MAKLPKPTFQAMEDAYRTDPTSVHDCPRLYSKDTGDITLGGQHLNTCAIRFTEGLSIALGLVKNRSDITKLTKGGGDGRSFLLGPYGYKAKLCPHGIGRGASDVAYFLVEQWGNPTHTFKAPGEVPKGIKDLTGAVSFIKIPGYSGQGHMDIWHPEGCLGSREGHDHHYYWSSEKVFFWKLE